MVTSLHRGVSLAVAVSYAAILRRTVPTKRMALVSCAALALVGCHREVAPAAPLAVVMALPVHPEGSSAGGNTMRYPVEVAARYSNAMSFRVAGKLIERGVRLGDTVRKGQMIARLDAVDAQKQAAIAQAALEAAEHRLVFAKQQLDRDTAQSAQNLIAGNQLEQTQEAHSSALATRDQAVSQLVVARNTLQYHTLVVDHGGLITSENADTGQVVSAGQPVYGLAWNGDIDAILDAAANDLGRIATGQAASVTFPSLPGRRFDARVREISPAADAQSRTYRVKLTLQPDAAVRLGMTGDATLSPATAAGKTIANAPTFKVAATAIFHQGKDAAVWVIRPDDSTLELRPVIVTTYGERSVVVTGGLKDGESVVLAGVHVVHAGLRVTPVKPLFDSEGEVKGPVATGTSKVAR